MTVTDERRQQRLDNFSKTVQLLDKACATKIEDERDMAGIIQFFEMAIELSWKCMRDYLLYLQYEDPVSPKASVKSALTNSIVTEADAEQWLKGLNMRNLTSHTYDEETAKAIVSSIKADYLHLIKKVFQTISA